VKPAPFAYHAPETVADAVGLLREHGDDAKPLAGGQSLVPLLALRLTRFAHLVDLNRIAALQGLRQDSAEVLTAVRFPVRTERGGWAIEEFARRAGDFAVTGAACAVALGDDGRVERAGIALFGMGSTPLRATEAERALVGSTAETADSAEIGRLATAGTDPPDDLHGTAAYRRKVGAHMTARAVARAVEEATRG